MIVWHHVATCGFIFGARLKLSASLRLLSGLLHYTHLRYLIDSQSQAIRALHRHATCIICRSKCTKNNLARAMLSPRTELTPSHETRKLHRTKPVSHLARAPRHPLGEISDLSPDESEGRRSISSVCTLSRGGFQVIYPFFWSSELLRDCLRPVIRSLPKCSVMGRCCRNSTPRLRTPFKQPNANPCILATGP